MKFLVSVTGKQLCVGSKTPALKFRCLAGDTVPVVTSSSLSVCLFVQLYLLIKCWSHLRPREKSFSSYLLKFVISLSLSAEAGLFFFLFWLHPWRMEVPRPGTEPKLELPRNQSPSCSNARSLTHCATVETPWSILYSTVPQSWCKKPKALVFWCGFCVCVCVFLSFFRATPTAYGGFQTRGQIRL